MALLTSGTILELSGITLRDYSARDLTLEIRPVDPGELAYDVAGTLHDLTMERYRKYQFTISCNAVDAPVLDDVWKGKLVTITVLPNTGLSQTSEDEEQSFDCMLVEWSVSNEEWSARTGWSVTLLQR